jgi:hypothetical protein
MYGLAVLEDERVEWASADGDYPSKAVVGMAISRSIECTETAEIGRRLDIDGRAH